MEDYQVDLLAGILLLATAAVLLVGNFLGESTLPYFLGLIGLFAIGISVVGFRRANAN
jgi:hypothetical protein